MLVCVAIETGCDIAALKCCMLTTSPQALGAVSRGSSSLPSGHRNNCDATGEVQICKVGCICMHPACSANPCCADSLLTLHAVEHRGRRVPLKHW